MHIAVIGSGYVGLVTGACFAEFGVDVVCVDIAADKVQRLNSGDSPIYEPGLDQLLQKNLKAGRLSFTTDIASAIKQSLVIFIAVGTPPNPDGSADLSFVEGVAEAIADHMDSYKVIATKYVESDPAKGVAFQRPLCPYPQVAMYKGSGDIEDAKNFECRP